MWYRFFNMSNINKLVENDHIMCHQTDDYDHDCRVSIIAGEVIIKKFQNENNNLSRHEKVLQSPTRIQKYSNNKLITPNF